MDDEVKMIKGFDLGTGITVDNGVIAVMDETQRMWELAQKIAPARFIPEAIRGDVPSVFYMLHTAADLGLKWTFAFRTMYLDRDGELAMKGAAVLALLQLHKFKVQFIRSADGQPVGCTCRITRPGEDEPTERSFTMVDAERIKTHWNGDRWVSLAENPWYTNHPEDMTQWRSLARCARVAAADLTGGIYLPEELQENRGGPAGAPPVSEAEPEPQFVVGEKPESPEVQSEAPQPVAETAAPGTPESAVTSAQPVESAAVIGGPGNVVEMPVATPKPPAECTFEENLVTVATAIGSTQEEAHTIIAAYFSGYLGTKQLPKSKAKLGPPLIKLAEVVQQRVGDLKKDPGGLGAELAGRVVEPVPTPEDKVKGFLRRIQEMTGQTDKMLQDWLANPIGGNSTKRVAINDLEPAALEIFLQVFLLIKGRAWELIDWAVDNNQPIAGVLQKAVEVSGIPIEKWDAKTAAGIVDGLPKGKPQAAAAPKPQPKFDDDDALPFS